MDKLKMMSVDKVQRNIEKIRALFPNAVTEVLRDGKPELKVDFDVLKQELADTLIDDRELRYQFTWPDKQKSVLLANTPIDKTLRPCKEESVEFDNTQNLYIEGDNLEVLKLLQETYLGKIKMIYIDPPYNTGNDFVYNDDFSQNSEEYMENSGQFDEQGNRLFQNTESNGRFHTDWLNMIYPRLRLAKDLLSDDGAIFISIDDNEVENLKKVCNEIFGETNFIGEIIRKTKSMTGDDGKGFNLQHESLMIYAKSADRLFLKGKDKTFDNYENLDNDANGEWCSADPSAKSGGETTYFEIINPYTGKKDLPPKGRYWAFSKSTLQEYIKSGKIVFKREYKENERGFIFKRYKKDAISLYNPINSLFIENAYMNQAATTMLNSLFKNSIFNYPKPVNFILELIKSIANKHDIVLDFFSGSATTAHAVMQLNAEDGGNRKFIMVQLPEPCDEKSEAYKAGYRNICEIGKERIRRAGAKIKKELGLRDKGLDIGFRVLKLDESNMKPVYYNSDIYEQARLDDMVDNIKADRTPLDLLFQVMLDLGKPLSAKIEEKDIAGKHVYIINDDDLIACFDSNVTEETVKAIAQLKPLYAVFRDGSLSSDSTAANFDQIFATYSPNTIRKVL